MIDARSRRWGATVAVGSLAAVALLSPLQERPAAASPAPLRLASALRALPRGARAEGPLAWTTPIRLDVALAVRDPAALGALVAGVDRPGSPQFGRFLRRGQFAARFGATPSEVMAVEAWLRGAGLTVTGVAANRLTIHVRGPARAVASGLRTAFQAVAYDGRLDFRAVTAPLVPASVAPLVTGIVGLDDLPAVSDDLVVRHGVRPRSAAGPTSCGAAVAAAHETGGLTAADLARVYGMDGLYELGDLGRGVRVGIAEFEPDSSRDVAAYQRCYGTAATVHYVHVDGGAGRGTGGGEAALDIEDVVGLAPQVAVDVYQGPISALGDDDLYAAIVAADVDRVVTTSWGECEPLTEPSLVSAEATTFAQAVVQGQVVFAASGDDGSTDCARVGVDPYTSALAVDDPASQPDVLGVGGTTATPGREVVWNSDGGASGGGVSGLECMGPAQDDPAVAGVVTSVSQTDPTLCTTGAGYLREVPDVAADADPQTGYEVVWAGTWQTFGGTSAAAPLWAATAALTLASPYCSAAGATVGVTAASLYGLAATPSSGAGLEDVLEGDNVIPGTGYAGSLYEATPGYDETSGLGTPVVTRSHDGRPDLFRPGLASLVCELQRARPLQPVVDRVVPDRVASDRPTAVTVVGSGFLPARGAVRLAVDGASVAASCSATRCRALLPGLGARTADVRVLDQTYAESPAGVGDLVTFVPAPVLRGLGPGAGPSAGGTRVTLHGSGFTGTVTVRFGARRARVRVRSDSTLVVVAPAGSGTVEVTVAATGGVSAATARTTYRYLGGRAARI